MKMIIILGWRVNISSQCGSQRKENVVLPHFLSPRKCLLLPCHRPITITTTTIIGPKTPLLLFVSIQGATPDKAETAVAGLAERNIIITIKHPPTLVTSSPWTSSGNHLLRMTFTTRRDKGKEEEEEEEQVVLIPVDLIVERRARKEKVDGWDKDKGRKTWGETGRINHHHPHRHS